ncbi:MAG: ISAs1 family transposase [Rhodoplanes sp.]|uniref:ISAs1 family transposase n=1 Tax=Rhodoplanes sp. TaxID=1968906 RepID=UPI0018102C79|nr:ISAs1 family transposase [Rhodoplanes sp.]NVO13603.1 ISAs1 family transposase [Rhodoplanes sp.]
MVSAFTTEMRMTLSSPAAKDGDEVSAALELLGLVDLADKIVTADALHCHRRMAHCVVARVGDYSLAVKGNQESPRSYADECFLSVKKKAHPTDETTERGPRSHQDPARGSLSAPEISATTKALSPDQQRQS